MARLVEIGVTGSVTVTSKVNIRQGTASRLAPLVRKMAAGSGLDVVAIAAGEEVQGNRLWYRLPDGSYVWTGACGPFVQGVAAPLPSPVMPSAYQPPVAADYPAASVIDLYHGDQVTSFDAARVAGVVGIIHKATTGATGRDDRYRTRRKQALDAGLLWGAYHWGTAAPANKQIDNFLQWADPDEQTLVALDYELDAGNQMTLARAREFLELIEQKLGRKAVIYSGHTLKEALGNRVDPFFGGHRLWLAQYGPVPRVHESWKSYWLWQFTEGKAGDPRKRIIPGIPGNSRGELDCDHFSGTVEQLAVEWAS